MEDSSCRFKENRWFPQQKGDDSDSVITLL